MSAPTQDLLDLRIQLVTASRSHKAALRAFERCPSAEMDRLVRETLAIRDGLLDEYPFQREPSEP